MKTAACLAVLFCFSLCVPGANARTMVTFCTVVDQRDVEHGKETQYLSAFFEIGPQDVNDSTGLPKDHIGQAFRDFVVQTYGTPPHDTVFHGCFSPQPADRADLVSGVREAYAKAKKDPTRKTVETEWTYKQ